MSTSKQGTTCDPIAADRLETNRYAQVVCLIRFRPIQLVLVDSLTFWFALRFAVGDSNEDPPRLHFFRWRKNSIFLWLFYYIAHQKLVVISGQKRPFFSCTKILFPILYLSRRAAERASRHSRVTVSDKRKRGTELALP